ncbi:hypothetical protein FA041_27285 [Escherichia coli]|nr:hypothetical protein [Escherichia coli]
MFICLGCIINICRERTTRNTSNHLNISLFIDVLNFNYQNSEKFNMITSKEYHKSLNLIMQP